MDGKDKSQLFGSGRRCVLPFAMIKTAASILCELRRIKKAYGLIGAASHQTRRNA